MKEDRRPLKDVVALVVDQSESNQIGERPRQTAAARAELEKRLAALDNVEVRVVETPRGDPDNRGTQLFAALRSALADTPPERVGGAMLLTDGDRQRHSRFARRARLRRAGARARHRP